MDTVGKDKIGSKSRYVVSDVSGMARKSPVAQDVILPFDMRQDA